MDDRTRGIKALVTGGVAVVLAAGVALGANSLLHTSPVSQNVVLAGDQLTPEPTETPEAAKTPEPTETPEATEAPEPTETPEAKDSQGQNESSGQHGDNGTKTPEPTEAPDGGSSDGGSGDGGQG